MKLKYFSELKRSMVYLAKQKKTLFIGQAVEYPGTAMYNTLSTVSRRKKLELPVAEEMQMGVTLGMALNGLIPVSIYPRWNFLLLAVNQLINHIDKINDISDGEFDPRIIIRTAVGSKRPLNPQSQHLGDFTKFFKESCKNINIQKLNKSEDIFKTYKSALISKNKINLIVEVADFYNEK